MRTALIGARGQLGSDLLPLLGADVVPLGHSDIEITDRASVEAVLAKIEPEFVVNTAAYNFVDKAEEETERAFSINALGPRNLAASCERRGIPLLHVSTDYVFGRDSERGTPYLETDSPGPVSVYGMTKRDGEEFVLSGCRQSMVVRTCGLYGHAARGGQGKGNFVETMLRLGSERSELRIVDDQHCTPTATSDLARAIAALIPTRAWGVYHVTNTDSTTWCRLAQEIFRIEQMDVTVVPISSQEFGAKAGRPRYSVLDQRKFAATVGFELPHWKTALARYLEERRRAEH